MDVSPAVSLDEVVVSTIPLLVLGSKLLGQVSSARCIACPESIASTWVFLAPSRICLPL